MKFLTIKKVAKLSAYSLIVLAAAASESNFVFAGYGMNRNLNLNQGPVERQRGWRRGNPHDRMSGPTGNENSDRPQRPVGVGPVLRDQQREDQENRNDPARRGCPDGTMSVVFAPDNLSFTVLFDKFAAQTQAGQHGIGGSLDAVRCDVLVPLQIPDGMQMSITRVDYRGFVNLPEGSVGNLMSAYAFVGASNSNGRNNGPDMRRDGGRGRGLGLQSIDAGMGGTVVSFNYRFTGPISDNYLLSSDAFTDKDAISPCGGATQLALRNVARIQNPPRNGADATLTVDSIDGQGQLVYFVRWDRCGS